MEQVLHGSAKTTAAIRYDCLRFAKALHRSLQKLERSLAISALRGNNLEDLTFVTCGTPEVERFAVDPDEHLLQMPSPMGIASMLIHGPPPDFSGKHRTKAVSPELHSFVAEFDVALEQEILDLPK